MSLSREQVAALRALAEQEGVDPDELVSVAKEESENDEPAEPGASSGPLKADRLLIGHFPYMTTNEIRAAVGLSAIPGGDMPSGAWLAKNGGAQSPGVPEPE